MDTRPPGAQTEARSDEVEHTGRASGSPASEVGKVIDARGMACPGPLLSLIGAIRAGAVGDVYEVISSDAGSRTDIPAWVAKAKHELVGVVDEPGYARFIVRKAR